MTLAARSRGRRGRHGGGLRARLPRPARFDPRRGSERAWLFGIARNAALDELRRRRRTAALVVDPADPEATGAAAAEEAPRRAVVRAALASLDARDRELVALKFVAGLSNAEIADGLGARATPARAAPCRHQAAGGLP